MSNQEIHFTPAKNREQVDPDGTPQLDAPYFDTHLGAWVLTRYADLMAAFQAESLIPGRRDVATLSLVSEETARLTMREETRDALSPARIRAWRERLSADADRLCRDLPQGKPIDLLTAYARPLCLSFAATVTGISQSDAGQLEELAQIASAAAANPEDPALRDRAKSANQSLRGYFNAGPEPLRDSGFVGLSQTLARIVSAAWYALIQSPDQWALLHRSPESMDRAMEELLRYAGNIRTLTRTATADIDLNGVSICKGDQLILKVSAANHDPARFSRPDQVDCNRRDPSHLTLGAGGHACVAGNLIRTAAITMTSPLLTQFASAALAREVEWHGGSVMYSPACLWVTFACS